MLFFTLRPKLFLLAGSRSQTGNCRVLSRAVFLLRRYFKLIVLDAYDVYASRRVIRAEDVVRRRCSVAVFGR